MHIDDIKDIFYEKSGKYTECSTSQTEADNRAIKEIASEFNLSEYDVFMLVKKSI